MLYRPAYQPCLILFHRGTYSYFAQRTIQPRMKPVETSFSHLCRNLILVQRKYYSNRLVCSENIPVQCCLLCLTDTLLLSVNVVPGTMYNYSLLSPVFIQIFYWFQVKDIMWFIPTVTQDNGTLISNNLAIYLSWPDLSSSITGKSTHN